MRIIELELHNFRCFTSLKFTCNPQLNVIIGENASGKTALIRAIRLCLGTFLGKFKDIDFSEKSGLQITIEDIRFDRSGKFSTFTSLESTFSDGINKYTCGRKEEGRSGKSTRIGASNVDDWVSKIEQSLNHPTLQYDLELPLVAFFSTDRISVERKFSKDDKLLSSRIRGYFNALGNFTNTEYLKEWFKNRQLEKYQHPNQHSVALDLMRKAISHIPGVTHIEYIISPTDAPNDEVSESDLYLTFTDGQKIGFNYLSDGQKAMVSLIADIAMRCLLLNPQLNQDANQTAGIVLIDEVDLHLHPAWQRKVIPALLAAFPNIQFFITTHSPQVISTVSRDSLFILKNFIIENPLTYIEGRDSNSILSEVFDEEKRPSLFQQKLDKFYQSLEDKKEQEARALLEALEEAWGPTDAEIVRADLYYQDLLDETYSEETTK